MIEVIKTYNLLQNIDQQSYLEYSDRAIRTLWHAPGIVEIRVYRNLLGSLHMRLTLVWHTLADWAKFAESPEGLKLESELLNFASVIDFELWVPLHAGKLTSEQRLTVTKRDFKLTWD